MVYKFLPLTVEESKTPGKYAGALFVQENKSRWVDIQGIKDEITTYDRGYTVLHYKGVLYNIHRDIIFIDSSTRVYIGTTAMSKFDSVIPKEDPKEEEKQEKHVNAIYKR